ARVFKETKKRFVFQIRRLSIADDHLTFYIKPADGMQLPAIMKWLKQVFAQRYNQAEGRVGHIWGDRYGSWVLPGEPPVEEVGVVKTRVRPYYKKSSPHPFFLPPFSPPFIPSPG
ncbi:MAG: transposase, partial [Spirochaetaceae bacterium]|nr:transposase [Spirochaetaceae bacterium]